MYLGRVGAQGGFGSEAFAAYGTLERPVLGSFQLGIVVAEVLLQVGQLDKGSSTFRHVATVGSLTCNSTRNITFIYYVAYKQ